MGVRSECIKEKDPMLSSLGGELGWGLLRQGSAPGVATWFRRPEHRKAKEFMPFSRVDLSMSATAPKPPDFSRGSNLPMQAERKKSSQRSAALSRSKCR
ncbi:hypothetical protein NDU88_003588 [Pleurodeles waltl]|uniref:Uncharacterized protein n=1 Tax=Pleurodeles waltl TaxID=8319 RepID=A0AAV7KYI4_PLEWA|nr:hypothetical protein NDU88_003588 [Pleurodeles waltl]